MPAPVNPTTETYSDLSRAFDHFNRQLFARQLPRCLITYQRYRGVYGYFCVNRFESYDSMIDEIALNPRTFANRTLAQILSTLVHEMCHLEQEHFGTPGKTGYHNLEFAQYMKAVGLMPSDTGQPGGKETGRTMTHYIMPEGAFDRSCRELLAKPFVLPGDIVGRTQAGGTNDRNKIKYVCPGCRLNAWAKPNVHLVCGECGDRLLSC